MKVSLLTYHKAENYGATMQTYATLRVLHELGQEVELIDLEIDQPNPILKKIILLLKKKRFDSFRKKYLNKKTKKYNSLEELRKDPPKADIYMVGSDQTWNPDISKEKTKAFFLDFGAKNVVRCSYASSFGKDKWEDTTWISRKEASELFKKINYLSVREDTGVEILKKDFNLEVSQVIDPVLLHKDYSEIIGDEIAQRDEIILYKLVEDHNFYKLAKDIGRINNISTRSIGSIRKIKGIESKYPETVENWIKNIAGAKYVFTDSFHGVVVSLLYKKEFIVFVGNPKLVTRIQSLLKLVNLEHRILTTSSSVEEVETIMKDKIDYNIVSTKIDTLRKESIDYLSKIFKI